MPHTRRIPISLMIGTILLPALAELATAATAGQEPRVPLRDNWALESGCRIKAPGDEISKVGFDASGWHKTQVPTTVVGALVADKTYPDPYFGMNMRSLPGTNFASRRLVRRSGHAGRQSLPLRLVVPHGVYLARELSE